MRARLVMAREALPALGVPSVFLAGPTSTLAADSWRPDAIELLADRWSGPGELVVLSPESRDGVRAETYRGQVLWEREARAVATVVLYWIWRDMLLTPGQTTNVEYGYDVASGRTVVLGCPPDCPDAIRNRYLVFTAEEEGVPVRETLPGTVDVALDLVLGAGQTADGTARRGPVQ